MSSTSSSSSLFSLPQPLRAFFSYFPLYVHEPIGSPYAAQTVTKPTLWVRPPRQIRGNDGNAEVVVNAVDCLSSDVECLKWQAYLALRGVKDVLVRFDISPEGGIDGRLPNLHVPLATTAEGVVVKDDGNGELLPAHMIPEWVAKQVGDVGELEGYVDVNARDESRAWVSLLEGDVHAALMFFTPPDITWLDYLAPYTAAYRTFESVLVPPPAPLTGLSSIIPPYGVHIDRNALELKYKEAITSLSIRLGTDKWFLGSAAPTALDALLFAYLHCLLHSRPNTSDLVVASSKETDALRFEVTRRVNLVAWERRVRGEVQAAFHRYTKS